MPLHLLKLSVGCDSVRDLEDWIAQRQKERARRKTSGKSPNAAKQTPEHIHITRMVPKRADELLDGGSLYWVIRGEILCRQTLIGIRPFTDKEGIGRCRLVMDPKVIPVNPRPFRPFQGWRYLAAKDAPADLDRSTRAVAAMPEALRRELRDLGLL
jgi:hypothetical protein